MDKAFPASGDLTLSLKSKIWFLWHRRMGHVSKEKLLGLFKSTRGLTEPLVPAKVKPCEPCIYSKQLRIVNRIPAQRAEKPLGRVYSDYWGPYWIDTLGGNRYFLSFTDDATRRSDIILTPNRQNTRMHFLLWKARAELRSGHKLGALRTDNAKEFLALQPELEAMGATLELTVHYTPEQNGVAERLNRTLITMAKAMLFDSGLPQRFWGEAVTTANYIRNRLAIGPNGMTPEEAFTKEKPSISHMRAFGCLAYAFQASETRKKLDPNSIKTVFVGYEESTRQYRVYDPVKDKLIRSSNVEFYEDRRLEFD